MAYSEQELLTFEQIKGELLALCKNTSTGDLCLFTAEKHAAVISFNEGEIVGLRYRISRGNDALRLIKGISNAKIRFQKGASSINTAPAKGILPTVEILKILGVEQDGCAFQGPGKKILVVEDSATQRKIICKMLVQNGYRILEAKDGYEALSIATHETPDLVLLDIIMPGIDGYKVMSSMKELPGMKRTPIIMLTSRDKLIDKMRGKVSGTNEYLTKPFKRDELIEKIEKYLTTDNALKKAKG
ncbi:MAG: response regulator [Gammaproteobacteria bacterium]|nr:response regulator [Gammaproteobacteria bacterium]MCK5262953.1 response regulator [Gammaproteobacteria bacterium]